MRLLPKRKRVGVSKHQPVPRLFLAAFIAVVLVISPVVAQFQPGGGFQRPRPRPIGVGIGGVTPEPNPTLVSTRCNQGMSIALVVDVSGSMAGAEEALKSTLRSFVNSLTGPNGRFSDGVKISLTYFANSANAIPGQALTDQAGPLLTAINGYRLVNGTNWAEGIQGGHATLAGVSGTPRLLIMMSDGDPRLPFPPVPSAIRAANVVKLDGVRMMGVGIETNTTGNTFAPGGSAYNNLRDITNGDLSVINAGSIPDVAIANVNGALGTILENITQGACAGPGNGNGGNGNGIGGDGNGIGNNGTGVGQSGTGQGISPQSPAPSPNPAPAPSAKPSPNPQPNPAPTPKAQGIATIPPPQPPSPFYDGKEYTPASEPATFAKAAFNNQNMLLWIGGAGTLIALAGLGGWLLSRGKKGSSVARRK